jgi:O-succinylbenzoic acid--CoA ligase
MTAIYYKDQKISYRELLDAINRRQIPDPIFPVTHSLDCVINVLTCLIKGIPFLPYSPLLPTKPNLTFPKGCDLILHTSGSSKMKFLSFSKKAMIDSCMNTHPAFMLSAGDVYLLNLPLYHVAGLCILLRAFLRGACVAIDPINPCLITHVSMVPAQTDILREQNPFPNLKALLLGGSAIPTSLADFLCERGYPLYVTYGMTETCSHVFVEKYKQGEGVYFTKPLRGRKITINNQGILLVKAPWMKTYHNTKDRFSFKDGQYRVLGRADSMFISGGENIYPNEIKNALMKITGIKRVKIEIKEHFKWGNRPFVSIYTDGVISLDAIKKHLFQSLEHFKIPKDHEIALYSLPQDLR